MGKGRDRRRPADRSVEVNGPSALHVNAAMRLLPLHEDEPCGDAAVLHALPGGAWLAAIVDGLGHGEPAALAAQAALRTLAQAGTAPLANLLPQLQSALADTRGAAVGLLHLQGWQGHHVALGNTRTMRWRDGRLLRLFSQYGIAGGGLPARVDVTTLDLRPGDCVLMATDGVDERLELPVMLPEWRRKPALLCDHLLARWRQPQDDAGVLVLQIESA